MKKHLMVALEKFTENILSIKVWIIFVYMLVSSYLVMSGKMSGGNFAASNGSIISIVLAIREVIKVQKIKATVNSTPEQLKEIDKLPL